MIVYVCAQGLHTSPAWIWTPGGQRWRPGDCRGPPSGTPEVTLLGGAAQLASRPSATAMVIIAQTNPTHTHTHVKSAHGLLRRDGGTSGCFNTEVSCRDPKHFFLYQAVYSLQWSGKKGIFNRTIYYILLLLYIYIIYSIYLNLHKLFLFGHLRAE